MLFLLACLAQQATASPWVDAGDVRARHHLLVLVDHGAINLPTSTWPLMWNDIKLQLDTIDITGLSPDEVWSYRYLKHRIRLAKQDMSGYASVYQASNRSLTPASNTELDRAERQAAANFISNHFAARIQGNFVHNPQDGDTRHYDGSFIAASAGNWVLGVGKIQRWWGPGWHSSMSLSTSARPASGVFIQRSDSRAFPLELPWTITAFASQLDDNGSLPDTEMNGARLSLNPLPILEAGAQQIDVDSETEAFSYQGLDWRLSFNLIGFQSAFYHQLVRRRDDNMVNEPEGELAGLETSFNLFNMHHRLVLESSESDPNFSDHYEFFGRELGYMAGNNGSAKSVLGFHYLANGHQIEWLLTRAEVEVWPEELEYLQATYRFPFGDNMLISFGAIHYRQAFRFDDGEYIRPGNFIKLEYAF